MATAVLAEIDARWAELEEQEEESHRVYLDWLAETDSEFRRALRQGWRALRIWPLMAWTFGFFAFISFWSDDPQIGLLVAAVGVSVGSVVPILLGKGDPEWLDLALGVDRRRVFIARWKTGVLYSGRSFHCFFAGDFYRASSTTRSGFVFFVYSFLVREVLSRWADIVCSM